MAVQPRRLPTGPASDPVPPRYPGSMLLRLLLLFTLVPALEIYLLVRLGGLIGAFNTLLVVLITGVLGAYYVRRQGVALVLRIQERMNQGELPGEELINGAMLLVGGAFLVTPGFLTDAAGLALVLPPTRDTLKGVVRRYLERRMRDGQVIVYRGDDPPAGRDRERRSN